MAGRLPYFAPPDSNLALESEPIGADENGVLVERQRVSDPLTQERLVDLLTAVGGPENLVDLLRSIRDNTGTGAEISVNTDELEGLLADVRDRLIGFRVSFDARDLASAALQVALRDRLDTLNTKDFATAALQSALLAELQGKANAGDAQLSRPSLETRQRQGLAFMSSTGRLMLATTGFFRATIYNPPTNTRTVFIQRVNVFASAGPAFAHLYVNPTTNLPVASTRPVNNSRIGSPTQSPVEVRGDTSATGALSGGIDTGIDLALPVGRTVIELAPLSIPPGVTLGINVPFTGASDVVLTGYWYEES